MTSPVAQGQLTTDLLLRRLSGFSQDFSLTPLHKRKGEDAEGLRQNQKPRGETESALLISSAQCCATGGSRTGTDPAGSPFHRVKVAVGPTAGDRKNGSEDTREKNSSQTAAEGSRPRSRRLKIGCQGAPPSGVSGVMGGPRVLRRITLSEGSR